MSDRILVLNSGSSSLKYRLFNGSETIQKGLVENIGEPGGVPDHDRALRTVVESLDLTDLAAVGHRVVHGGSRFAAPTLVTDAVVAEIRELNPLAPLHNPANIAGIEVARRLFPTVASVAVFDTAFHQSMPPEASTYAIDADLAHRLRIRRYGFHGTSHAYVSRRTASLIGRDPQRCNVITLHLGNGASACAVRGGLSVATSMGFTPLEGLVMGTRSGDLDPAVVLHLQRVGGLSPSDVDHVLNRHGGLLGLCGDNDMRAVLSRREAGDPAASLAFDTYCHRIRGYVGAYAFELGRLDAITFTAGVGENAAAVRASALAGLDGFGISVDPVRNQGTGERAISPPGAPVSVWVVPTDEEFEIANQVRALLG